MIFVTVGNSIKGVEFHRLIKEMDDIARDLKEDVVAQIGFIEDPPRHIRSFSYMNYVEIQSYFRQASVIVGHCGVGTVIHGLGYGKPIILVPRSQAHGEHIDNHQFELAKKLKGMEGIFVVEDVAHLRPTLLEVRGLLERKALQPHFSNERARLLTFMRNYVEATRAELKK
jgi:UDP-N-acetylglucosamine transferase subunit ALG13